MGSRSLDVTEGRIGTQLLLLCVPVFFSSFFQEAYSLVNTFVVGQFAGKAALGGIQATAPLVDLAVGFSVGMGTGFSVVCSQYFGAHDDERLRASVHTAMTIALVGGIAAALFFINRAFQETDPDRTIAAAGHDPPVVGEGEGENAALATRHDAGFGIADPGQRQDVNRVIGSGSGHAAAGCIQRDGA